MKNNKLLSYIPLIVPVLAIITAIVGLATKGLLADTFPVVIAVMLFIGAAASTAAVFLPKFSFIKLIPIVFYGIALGYIFFYGVEVLVYAGVGIDNNVGGNESLVTTYLVLSIIVLVLSIVNTVVSFEIEKD